VTSQRLLGERTGKRFARRSLIAGLKNNQPVAPMVFCGYCETEVVLAWAPQMVIPALEPEDGVIGDNASSHRSPKIAQTLSNVGIGLLFLSPYSPDLNLIE
jgi:isftu1 transposase